MENDKKDMRRRPARDGAPKRKPLKIDIAEVDQEILRLLIRRHNMLARMRDRKGRLDPTEEKFLRESWQQAVARVSRDANLSSHFFSLMQEVSFLPRPKEEEPASHVVGAERRQAFNLAPPRLPVTLDLAMPGSSFAASSWLYLAAAHGAPLELENCLMNDGEIDLVKALNQMGAALNREDLAIAARPAAPLGAPDKVIHLGDDPYNFYLALAHYLGRPSRVKFSGDARLKLADLSFLKNILPECGARLVHVVPKSFGLPARLEATGVLPPAMVFEADLPPLLACALLLAATAWSAPFGLDLARHPQKEEILARILPILEEAGATFNVAGGSVNIQPAPLKLPKKPSLPVEPLLCAFLLAFGAPGGGAVKLRGRWPSWPSCGALWRLLCAMGLPLAAREGELCAAFDGPAKIIPPQTLPENLVAGLDEACLPLPLALCAAAALLGQEQTLVPSWPLHVDTGDFLRALGLTAGEDGAIMQEPGEAPPFNAPAPYWAVALALAAMARGRGQQVLLGNPGILTALWPGFWALYNGLPNPQPKAKPAEAEKPKSRRRILTDVVAVPPEIREEDWD